MKTLLIAGAALIFGAVSGPLPDHQYRLVRPAPTGIECTVSSVTIRLLAVESRLAIAIDRSLSDAGFRVRLV